MRMIKRKAGNDDDFHLSTFHLFFFTFIDSVSFKFYTMWKSRTFLFSQKAIERLVLLGQQKLTRCRKNILMAISHTFYFPPDTFISDQSPAHKSFTKLINALHFVAAEWSSFVGIISLLWPFEMNNIEFFSYVNITCQFSSFFLCCCWNPWAWKQIKFPSDTHQNFWFIIKSRSSTWFLFRW